MTRPECIEGGCGERMGNLEADMDHIMNPETGALGKIHEKINSKVSWSSAGIAIGVALFIIGGSFSYTYITGTASASALKEYKDEQDKRFDKLMSNIEKLQQSEEDQRMALYEHRAFTEGKAPKTPRRR